MPTLKYYDGSAYQQLPGMPGVTGPAGPTGPTGAQGPPAPGVTLNYVAVAWGPASPPVTGTQPLGLTVSLLANHSYLVTGYAIAMNVSASAAAARFCLTTAAAAGVPGPNAGVWIDYSANLAGDMVATNCYTKGTTASFVYQPLTDGNVTFWIYSTGTAGAFQFGANNCMISVADLTGTQGPIGATGATGPAGPAGGGSTIVSVRAWRQGAYTIPTTNTAFVFDNEQWDTQNAYNNTTGVFTAPVAGKYRVSAQIVSLGAAAVNQCITAIIQKNGTQVAQQFSEFASGTSPAQSLFAQVIDTLDLAVNDTVTFASYMVSGAALGVNPATSNTYMSIDLLSGTGPVGPTGPTGPAYAVGQMYSLAYYQTIPRPTVASSPYTVTHNLGTTFPLVQLYDSVTLQQVTAQVRVLDANRVQISVAQDMPNSVNIVIMGVAASPVPINPGDTATKAYVDAVGGDKGLLAGTVDLNTVTVPGNYQSAGGNPNQPPIPAGAFTLEVQSISGGTAIQQRATLVSSPNYIATREYVSGAWQAWKSPAAGMLFVSTGPPAQVTATGALWTAAPGVPVVLGRRYRLTLWIGMTNNNASTLSWAYYVVTDSLGAINWGAGGRIMWVAQGVLAAQSWYGSGSHSYIPTASGTPTFPVSNNANATAITVGANSCELTLEDMGTG